MNNFKIVGTLFTKIMPKCQLTKYSNFLENHSFWFFCNRGDTILRHGGLHTDLNQCNKGS